ncbi:LpqN/LpqT family lipoprotein [Mycobacterium sp. SMC-4]|uniref:LpqN/LpqT family lipoprotein n=1 Tax=Mycobacterium sp. SMC-4 TaxID=2857059 RepID=UPI003D0894BF
MTNPMRAGIVGIAAVALGIGLAACGSAGESTETTSSPTATTESTPTEAPTTGEEDAAAGITLDDYIAENNLVRTPVTPGDPGAPTIELPTPPGWTDMGADAPEGAYSALAFTGDPALSAEPATIVTRVFQLTGNVDPAKVLEYAPAHLRTLPEFQGPDAGQRGNLSGFESVTIGGIYVREGLPHMIAQKTVAIPGQDGLFVLQIEAEGNEDQAVPLMDATSAIDKETRIIV